MNLLVEYMSFDVSWFTTPAGLLVTVGLVCVIVGSIFLLLSGKKKDEQPAEEVKEEVKTDAPASATPAEGTNVPVEEKAPEQVAVPAVEVTPEAAPATEVVEEAVTSVEEAPAEVSTVSVEETMPEVVLEPVTNETPAEVPATDAVAVPAVETTPTLEPVKEETVSIYGGANPQVAVATPEEPRKAYGGADPLENTGALPRVEVPSEPVAVPAVETSVEAPVTPAADTTIVPAVEEVKEEKPVTATPTDDVETLEF